jgi:hypothetical protein
MVSRGFRAPGKVALQRPPGASGRLREGSYAGGTDRAPPAFGLFRCLNPRFLARFPQTFISHQAPC